VAATRGNVEEHVMKKLARGLAKLIFGNEGLSGRLERVAWVQALAKHLRVRELMNAGVR
jgi:hypothetical protein